MANDKTSLLSLTSAAEADLIPVRLMARESISELFRFEIEAVARETIDPSSMLNKPACLAVNHGGETTRYFHGVVAEFGAAETSGVENTLYRLVLVPQLAQADLRIDCRQFFNKTAQDIVKTILDDAGVTKTAFRLYSQPAQRKATAQYNETSLHFITRLMEEEGWFYFFEHDSDGHTLVVTNDNNGFTTIPEATARLGVGTTADMLTEFRAPEAVTHGKISLRDYDPDAPSKNLKVDRNTILKHGGVANREVFHWPALTRDTGLAKDRAKWRMEAAEAAVSLVSAGGAMASLVAGGKFKLLEKTGVEAPYVIREITHFAEAEARRPNSGRISYSNSFTAFAGTVPWRQPMATARPRMEGLHTAIVLGPSGEEIHTDDQGRIKIRFFWDWREDATADSSDWVRVVQPWAGNSWGGQFIPRVGTEVAVAFMDADPDRPVVVGGLYNGTDKPIFPVGEKTKTGLRSRSVLKGSTSEFNEFSFDDKKGSELVFLHAQKDLTTEVENDQRLTVGHDRTVKIDGKETVTIKGDQSIEIKEGDQSILISKGDHSLSVTLGNIAVKADAGKIDTDALQSITLKVGSTSLKLTPMGIEMKAMTIKIEGQLQTTVKGLMLDVAGSAMLTLKGGITMIN